MLKIKDYPTLVKDPKSKVIINMDIIVVSIIWFIALLSLKMYKDKIIYLQKEKMRIMEDIWTKGQKKN